MQNEKQKALTNLKKAKSLIEKIADMVEKDEYCIDIMQQNLAAVGLLRSAHQSLMENHLHHCFAMAMNTEKPQRKDDMIEEILTVTKLLNR